MSREEEANTIVISVPSSPEEAKRMESEQRWMFQRLSDRMQQYETRLATRVNNSKVLLTLTYLLLFAVSTTRIVLYFFLSNAYASRLSQGDHTMFLIESCLSLVWLIYFINQYISKLRLSFVENVRWASLMYVLFCIQYFSIGYWVIESAIEYMPIGYAVTSLLLFIVYGFVAEKSPNSLALTVYLLLMFFLGECVVRAVSCTCHNPWKVAENQHFTRKELTVHSYSSERFSQKSCAICLNDFVKDDQVCQLSCHETHVFHSACVQQWLSRNNYCPYCRTPLSCQVVTNSN